MRNLDKYVPYIAFFHKCSLLLMLDDFLVEITIVEELHDDAFVESQFERKL